MSESDPTKINRLPPHSDEAERCAIGCMLLDPKVCINEASSKIGSKKCFYDLRHQTVYETLVALSEEGVPVDLVLLAQRLKDKGQLESVGGLTYLAHLSDIVPSSANLEHYLRIVWEKYILRKMIRTCTDFVGRAYDHEDEFEELMDEVESDVLSVSLENNGSGDNRSMKELMQRSVSAIEDLHANKGKIMGIASGLPDIDVLTGGFRPGDMIVVAARPSVGKSSLGMQIAEHVGVDLDLPVGVFSLEMSADSLALRLLCSRARVDIKTLKEDGLLCERDFPKLIKAAGEFSKNRIQIDETSGLSILQLKARARRMHQQHGIKLLVVDYLQQLHSTNRRSENRQQEIADISNGLKEIAKELHIPVIVMAQLNREIEKRNPGSKPRMSDLRESGAIEQDADIVLLLYRKKDDDEEEYSSAVQVGAVLAKQRNGPTGDIDLVFMRQFTRFECCTHAPSE